MLYSLWPEELQLSYLLQPPDLQADVLQAFMPVPGAANDAEP